MKKIKSIVLVMALILSILTPVSTPITGNVAVAEAATIKLSKKVVTLEAGKTTTLTVSGTKKKITWSSNKKSVATVTGKGKTGKVTAISAGEAKITAKVGTKVLTCVVTVTIPDNPYLADAPFAALQFRAPGFSCVLPDWDYETIIQNDTEYNEQYYPEYAPNGSCIELDVEDSGEEHDSNSFREYLYDNLSFDYFKNKYTNAFGDTVFEIKDFKNSDFKTDLVEVFKSEHTLVWEGTSTRYVQYSFVYKTYIVTITSIDADSLDLESVAEYMVNSFVELQ